MISVKRAYPSFVWLLAAATAVLLATSVQASGISGTLSNFDVFNDTPTISDGAELELEGCHLSDVSSTYPSHYLNKSLAEYFDASNNFLGTRVTFTDYKFGLDDLLDPTVGQSTNGHTCVNTPGCEHFGFSARTQPTAMNFYWHDEGGARINLQPWNVPLPTWTYIAPVVVGDPPRIAAVVEVEPAEVHEQRPDSIWMRVVKTEIERPVDLDELISGGAIMPEMPDIEQETEWELLEGGLQGEVDKGVEAEEDLGEGSLSVIRRYEYFEYIGQYNEEHEPVTDFLDFDLLVPPEGELGDFIAANMVAINLVPEPSSALLALGGAALFLLASRRREGR